MMDTQRKHVLIIEYWFRILLKDESLSFSDITNIIIEFGKVVDRFDSEVINKNDRLELKDDEGTILSLIEAEGLPQCAHGIFVAEPGAKYHWRIQMLTDCRMMNIGIDVDTAIVEKFNFFWLRKTGYSYYGNGAYWHKHALNYPKGDAYGDKGDIIHVFLDLKEKYELSFGKNDHKFAKAFDVDESAKYKLFVSLIKEGKIQLLSLEVAY